MPVGDLTERFRALDWFQFEKIVALIYRKLGDEVERRGGANADGGLDLLVRRNGQTLGVQCKHWKTWQVGVKSVREFLRYQVVLGSVEQVFRRVVVTGAVLGLAGKQNQGGETLTHRPAVSTLIYTF